MTTHTPTKFWIERSDEDKSKWWLCCWDNDAHTITGILDEFDSKEEARAACAEANTPDTYESWYQFQYSHACGYRD